MTELAERAVACKHWRWMPGMLVISGMDIPNFRISENISGPSLGFDDLPDLADPATLGCLLALVRQAWDDPMMFVSDAFPDRWTVVNLEIGHHPTEAEALIAALEAAP